MSPRLSIIAAVLLVSTPAMAAMPFCLASQAIPPICIYGDASLCQQDAVKQGGECVPNPDQKLAMQGSQMGRYCAVTAGGAAQCVYPDIDTCQQETAKHNMACIPAPDNEAAKVEDIHGPGSGL